jgi:hypothetical protein
MKRSIIPSTRADRQRRADLLLPSSDHLDKLRAVGGVAIDPDGGAGRACRGRSKGDNH